MDRERCVSSTKPLSYGIRSRVQTIIVGVSKGNTEFHLIREHLTRLQFRPFVNAVRYKLIIIGCIPTGSTAIFSD